MSLLAIAVLLLGVAVLAGTALVIVALCWPVRRPSPALAILHGVLALIGYGLLLVALRGRPPGIAAGTEGFGTAAAILLLLAIAFGLVSVVLHWRRVRVPGFWMGAHATIAITGYVILIAYFFA